MMFIDDAKLTPHELIRKHRTLAKQERIKAATSPARCVEIRRMADEMRAQHPNLNIHEIYSIVGHRMNIL
jgi:hypothetical protein